MFSVQNYLRSLLYSLWLLPVSLFAFSQTPTIYLLHGVSAMLLMHLLVLPSAQLFEQGVKHGVSNVLQPALFLDILAILAATFISSQVVTLVIIYILTFKVYAHTAIRLKRFAIVSFLTVMLANGALLFAIIEHALQPQSTDVNALAMQSVSILVGAFYILTQFFTRAEDTQFGDMTLLIRMGDKRTLTLVNTMLVAATLMLALHFFSTKHLAHFYVFLLFFAPVAAYFRWWSRQGKQNPVVFESKFTLLLFHLAALSFSLFAVVIFLWRA